MKHNIYHELVQRGVPEFPVEHHRVDSNHPSYHMRLQWHNDVELERVLSGGLSLTLNDRTFELHAGDSVLIPGGIVHGASPVDCVYECVVFPPSILNVTQRTRDLAAAKLWQPVFFFKDPVIDRLFETVRDMPEGGEFQTLSDLYDVLHRAATQKDSLQLRSDYKVERIKAAIGYIEAHISGSISLAQLSKACSMSPTYFCSFFKEVTGKTPGDYITTFRMEAASKMLLAGKSVTETAFECGFNDVSYFISVFRKKTGLSPKQYAKKAFSGAGRSSVLSCE